MNSRTWKFKGMMFPVLILLVSFIITPTLALCQNDKLRNERNVQDWSAELVIYNPVSRKYMETVFFDEYLVNNQVVTNPFPKNLRFGIRFLNSNNTYGYDTIGFSGTDKATVIYTYKVFASDSPQAFTTINESCIFTSKKCNMSFPLSKMLKEENYYIYFTIAGFRALLIKTRSLDDIKLGPAYKYCNRIELDFELKVKGVSTKIKSSYYFSLKKIVEELPE